MHFESHIVGIRFREFGKFGICGAYSMVQGSGPYAPDPHWPPIYLGVSIMKIIRISLSISIYVKTGIRGLFSRENMKKLNFEAHNPWSRGRDPLPLTPILGSL